MIGQSLNNRYSVTTRLGQGAMGTVYRATDTQTGQEVALKVITHELTISPEVLERFKREGETLRQLKHSNIVGFIDAFQYNEQYVIVMEYVSGGSLHDLIKQGSLPVERALQIALDLCDALIRAHRINIIHRDLKPENVLLAEDGTPKLADFGVARLGEGTRMTRTGTQVGTPYYMAPEAWEGKSLDVQADIWSLGVLLFEMLTGQVPFGGDTGAAVMNKVLTTQLPDLNKLRADVPFNLTQIIKHMLTRDKNRRYQTMRQVAVELEEVQIKPAKVKPARWLHLPTGLGLILIISAILWVIYFQQSQTSVQVDEPTNIPLRIVTEDSYLILEGFESKDIKMTGFSVDSSLWEISKDEFNNGVYEVDNSVGSGSPSFSFGQDEWKNYNAQYRVRYLNDDGYVGLQIRCNGMDSYVINMSPGELYLASATSSGWARLSTVNPPIRLNEWYTVRIEALDDHLQIFIDDNRWIDVHNSMTKQGSLLMFAESGAHAQVDDIRVTVSAPNSATSPEVSTTTSTLQDNRIYLAKLPLLGSEVGWASLGIGKYTFSEGPFITGAIIKANGIEYPYGLFAHAPSELIFALGRNYSSFSSKIFIDGYNSCSGTAMFIVLLDDAEIFRSKALTYKFPEVELIDVKLNVSDGDILTLKTDALDGNYCDMTFWGDPYVEP